jgi:hypothetical protein
MSIAQLERITCDNPECTEYVDELIRIFPGRYELGEYVRLQVTTAGWVHVGDSDFCRAHCPH